MKRSTGFSVRSTEGCCLETHQSGSANWREHSMDKSELAASADPAAMTVDCRLSTVDSSRNQLQEPIEQIHGVMRTRPRLGVVLDGGARDILQHEAFDGAVVQVQMRQLRGAEVRLPAHGLVDV